MCISTIGDSYRQASVYLLVQGFELRDTIIDQENDSLAIDAQCRASFIAQIICSIVALPLTLLATIILPTIALCTEDKEVAWDEMKKMGLWGVVQLATIPTAFMAAFSSHEKQWIEPAQRVYEWQENCVQGN